jgi:hypothetical protein
MHGPCQLSSIGGDMSVSPAPNSAAIGDSHLFVTNQQYIAG